MSGDSLFDARLGTWLEDGPLTPPDGLTETVLAAFPAIHQRQAWRVRLEDLARPGSRARIALVAAAALVLAIVGARLFLPPPGMVGPPAASERFESVLYSYTIDVPEKWIFRHATRPITSFEAPWADSTGVDYLTPDAINGNPGIIIAGPPIDAGTTLETWGAATALTVCGPADTTEPTTVDGEPALLYTYQRCFGFFHQWVVAKHRDQAFHIVWINVGGNETKDRQTFTEVLATFRFDR